MQVKRTPYGISKSNDTIMPNKRPNRKDKVVQQNVCKALTEEIINNVVQIGTKPPKDTTNLVRISLTVKSKNINEKMTLDVHPTIEEILKDLINTIKKMQDSKEKPSKSNFIKRMFYFRPLTNLF